jgi:hypothetical protein
MKLWPLIAVVLAFNASAQTEVASAQAEINKLLKSGTANVEFGSDQPAPLTPKWSKLTGYKPITCNGDLCMEERYGLVSKSRKDTLPPVFKTIEIFQGKIFLSGDNWACIVDDNLKVAEAFDRAQVLSPYFIAAPIGKSYAVLDSLLRKVVPASYDSVAIVERWMVEEDKTPDFLVKKNGKWGVIDYKNQTKMNPEYDELIFLSGFRGYAGKKGKYAYVRWDSLAVTGFIYDSIFTDFSIANFVVTKGGKIGIMNDDGKELIKPSLDWVTKTSQYGCRCANMNGKFAVFSSRGKNLTGFVFEDFKPYQQMHDEMLLKKNGKWGFFGCRSQKELSPFIYDRVVSFSGYEAEMMLNGAKKKIELKDESK